MQSAANPGLAEVRKQHRPNLRSRCAGEIDGTISRDGLPLDRTAHLCLFKLAEEVVAVVIYSDQHVSGVDVCYSGQIGLSFANQTQSASLE